MKNNSQSQLRYKKLRYLIERCLETYEESEILEVFNKVAKNNYCEEKEKEEIISDLVIEGYCIFKPDSTNKAEQLREYAETNIFPYYNEQQTAILY